MTNQSQKENRTEQQHDHGGGAVGKGNPHRANPGDGKHGGADQRDDATGPLQDGENRGNTTRSTAGGGDHGTHR